MSANSVDLICVAQAAHWLHLEAFYEEARRVARDEGIIAMFGFREASVSPELNRVVERYIREVVGPYWPAGKELHDSRYASLNFPFREIDAPSFQIKVQWTAGKLLNLLDSYSGPQMYLDKHGKPPSLVVRDELMELWGGEDKLRELSIPLFVRVGFIGM